MGFRQILSQLGKKGKERKEQIKAIENEIRFREIVLERRKSANEREMDGYDNEEREESIKERLEMLRKRRDADIKYGHNPLNVKNITGATDWEVLKEKNIFGGKNAKSMFANQPFIHKNNRNLLKSNSNVLKSNRRAYQI